jgi:hypothetical protein
LAPLPLPFGRWVLERDFADASVVGGDVVRSKNELKVEELLLPLPIAGACGSSLPSLLEVLPEEWCVSLVWKDALERRRKLKSFRNEGITLLQLCVAVKRWWSVGNLISTPPVSWVLGVRKLSLRRV